MAVKTSATAKLQFAADGATYVDVGKVRDVSLNINRDSLETTGIGEADRSYVYGIRSTSGSGTLLYDSADTGVVELMDEILSDTENIPGLRLVLDSSPGVSTGTITGAALITAVGTSVSSGDIISVPISFAFSSKPTGSF